MNPSILLLNFMHKLRKELIQQKFSSTTSMTLLPISLHTQGDLKSPSKRDLDSVKKH